MTAWTANEVADQRGKTFVVTGANSGIGLEATKILAARGAHVVLACRSATRAETAIDAIRAGVPEASLEVIPLDLASLASVRAFAERFLAAHARLDGLVNNAGLMALPYSKTADGFEMQLGTNHLGHFALSGLLLPRLLETEGARLVTVASTAHRWGKMRWDDLMGERGYQPWLWYGQSKLANLLFHHELSRRLEAKGLTPRLLAVAAHPGYAATALPMKAPEMEGARFKGWIMQAGNALIAQGPDMGALPTLRALVDPDVKNGDYFGPRGPGGLFGYPVRVGSNRASRDPSDQARLWGESERLTGVRLDALD